MEDNHPLSKRRRLNAAVALSRPFKSPLRKPEPIEDASQVSPRTPDASGTVQYEACKSEAFTPGPELTASSPTSSQGMRPVRPTNRSALTTPAQSPLADPELLRLQKQERILQTRIAALREELNVAKQALRIESSSKDSELEGLITKWRHASQEAADEVFAGAQERVTRMGGLTAWRERSKRDAFQWDFEEEEKEHANEYGHTTNWGLGDVFAGEKNSSKAQEEESHDEEFTIEFMLKTLNIDLKIIGYDSAMGKWIRG
ncbi:uncharacterized protein N7473_010158 [Penicillium subrubescens]|uniref:Swi5-dependent recombination DNA repair protein 1 n=1 Tax=Penicillium subrubescens TaxID=1316194 RepID=A0A1Q5U1A9_9EURO|nr:uncharacterized protein N7473_010158 [Penicillium subrubescens]KAJ5883272.1 hypothetical protein N7473_010158 [Penicillium subrubescens]OKP06272.1 Swi5-dependent recombination DNA repair protein 1 [Penicillium subrubescens]